MSNDDTQATETPEVPEATTTTEAPAQEAEGADPETGNDPVPEGSQE